MYIYPYNQASESVKALRAAMDGLKIIRREGSKFKGGADKVVINWGCSALPEEVMKSEIINRPEAVAIAANKKLFFDKVKGVVSIPEYTEDKTVAFFWIQEGRTVFAREKLNGNSGDGITILDSQAVFNDYDHSKSKIYVKYVPKKDEYRIHVANGEVVDKQRKALRNGLDRSQANFRIRNLDGGFVFVREGVSPPQQVIDESVKAIEACGLDFGAVDVIWNDYQQKAYVLEINTAPGLAGSTVDTYVQALAKPRRGNRLVGGGGGEAGRGRQVILDDAIFDLANMPMEAIEARVLANQRMQEGLQWAIEEHNARERAFNHPKPFPDPNVVFDDEDFDNIF